MSLTIIKGPPNSGRTEEVRREYVDLLPKRPVLVVPGIDDIFDWERRLARDGGAFLGARIMHFKDLVNEILREGGRVDRLASGVQRRHLADRAISKAWPQIAERIARQPGLVDAMLDLIDEFRNGMIDPDTLDTAISGVGSGYLKQIGLVYREYLGLLDERDLTDSPGLAMKAAASRLDRWQGRPVFVAGFDDLTNSQLEILVRLAEETEVTMAITHEVGNPAMAVTEKLLGRLEERGATVRITTDRPDQPIDHDPLLFGIERRFGRGPEGQLEPGEALTLLRSSGKRGEAEAVAAEIAALIAGGTDPGQIAIAISSPATNGAGFRDLLGEFGIPVTLESETPAVATATGQAISCLLDAVSANGSATSLITFLRGPIGVDREAVDELESLVRQRGITSAAEAASLFADPAGKQTGSPPFWNELSEASRAGPSADLPALVASIAERISGQVLADYDGGAPGAAAASEAQIATAIARACNELQEVNGRPVTVAEVSAALSSGAVKTWAIPTQNTVRIASPYSLRAKRFEHLFMVSLQERAFSDSERAGPFLSPEARSTLGLPDFTDPELQELYLFYSCLSVPTRGLWLSARVADESGKAEYPSPLIAEVEALLDEGEVPVRRRGRSSSAITFAADRAPSINELVRSLATLDPVTRIEAVKSIDLTAAEGEVAESRIAAATETEESTRILASLSGDAAIAILGAQDTFSATAIESFLSCPYRWFIEKALRPKRFGPDPEPLAKGNLVHGVLARLFAEHRGSLPRLDDLDQWIDPVEPMVLETASDKRINLGSDSASHRTARRQATNAIVAYLRTEAARESPGFLPFELEAAFGMTEDGRPALEMNGWKLRGSIDRIDASGEAGVGAGQRGIVLDYKTGKSSAKTLAKIEREKKVQLQLYMHALKQIWKIEPTAGLYVPIVNGKAATRGLVDEMFAEDVQDLNHQKRDRTDIAQAISGAVTLADEAVAAMMVGRIEHDPNTCPNHLNHAAVPDWIAGEDGGSGPQDET